MTLPPGFDASSAAAGNLLLSAAASALTELKHEEATMRGAVVPLPPDSARSGQAVARMPTAIPG